MGLVFRKQIPGRADVNETFSKQNLHRTKRIYEKLVRSGEYRFGDLTAWFCGLDDKEKRLWEKEVAEFYPPDVQSEIVRVIQAALFHKDDNGAEIPIPIEFKWNGRSGDGSTQGVRTTYNPSGPSYLIELAGYPSPMGSSLFARRTGNGPDQDAHDPEE